VPVTDRSPAHDTRDPGARTRALRDGARWGYGRRLVPTTTFLAFAAVCSAWAILSELDTPIEATVLAILVAVPLSIVLVDPAAAVTAASVVPLARRRVVPAVIGLCAAMATWITARSLAAAVGPAPLPDSWALLECSTIALSQVALAAAVSRRRPASTSFGPGILLALVWYVVVAAPRLHQLLFDPPEHLLRWIGVLATSAAIAGMASLDPAHRTRRRAPARRTPRPRSSW
jgi:hypothetical protein